MLLIEGKQFALFFALMMFAIAYYMLKRAEQGNVPMIRRLAALDAIDEAVSRSEEMGKLVLVHAGYDGAGIKGAYAGDIVAGLAVQSYVIELCAKIGVRVIVCPAYPELLPMITETVQNAYLAAGRPEDFNEDDIRFFSNVQWPWANGVMGTMAREQPGAVIGIGPTHGEALLIAESSARCGAITILGTPSKSQVAFQIAVADYVLISEENFAAGAYLSKNPAQIGSIAGQDYIKLVVAALVTLGALTVSLGLSIVTDLLLM